jgi:hypothetical protein
MILKWIFDKFKWIILLGKVSAAVLYIVQCSCLRLVKIASYVGMTDEMEKIVAIWSGNYDSFRTEENRENLSQTAEVSAEIRTGRVPNTNLD